MKNIEIRKCSKNETELTTKFYTDVVKKIIAENTNYPKWRCDYPDHQSVISAYENESQYICLIGGIIAGAFVLNEDPAGAYEKGEWKEPLKRGEYLVIHTLAVDSRFRNMGIASKITEFCLDTAKNNGYRSVRVDVVPENYPAEKLYTKLGFTFAGEKDLERGLEDIPKFRLFEYNLNS